MAARAAAGGCVWGRACLACCLTCYLGRHAPCLCRLLWSFASARRELPTHLPAWSQSQFEDFETTKAFEILQRQRDKLLCCECRAVLRCAVPVLCCASV